MVDRQDIDALLISALYGELTPADEARLTMHLESHPADRSALDSLTEIRATIRTSGFSTIHVDPPQAISAMLLQEAARRAPKMVRAKDDNEVGWFARFVRSFAAHPAMAAATMLVMVAGIGGLLYMKNGAQLAEPTASDQSATITAHTSGSGSAITAPNLEPPAVPGGDSFGVDLSQESEKAKHEGAKGDTAEDKSLERRDTGVSHATSPMNKIAKDAKAFYDRETQAAPKKSVEHGMIVNRDEPTPKDLDQKTDPAMANGPTTGNAAGSGYAPPPPPQTSKVPAMAPKPEDARPVAPQQNNSTNSSALVAWAKDQHARVTTLVRDGNCRDAAQIAAQIAARANDYYNQYVANDRALKACTAYFNDAREKDAERTNKARAQKRVDANEVSPAPAPTTESR